MAVSRMFFSHYLDTIGFEIYNTKSIIYIENHIVSLSSLVSLNIEEKILDISISSLQLFIIMTYQMILTSDKKIKETILLYRALLL